MECNQKPIERNNEEIFEFCFVWFLKITAVPVVFSLYGEHFNVSKGPKPTVYIEEGQGAHEGES